LPLELTAYALAKACDVPRTRVERIMREEIGISADIALRLARYFGTTPSFWLKLQMMYELEVVGEAAIGVQEKIKPYVEERAAQTFRKTTLKSIWLSCVERSSCNSN
jgi:antitoxin HigA-1